MSQQPQAGGSLRIPMSWDAYLALGETKHHEHYDGVTVVNPPSRRHVLVARRLTRLLEDACPAGADVLPEFGWQPAIHTVFEPDILVVGADSPGPDLLRVAPLLVVEVTSPSTRGEDLGRKLLAYAEAGAPWYWIADLREDTLTVHRLERRGSVHVITADRGFPLVLDEPFPVTVDLAAVFG